jgi:hypothetical protein
MKNIIKIKYNGGAAMITVVIFFMFISLTILIGIVSPVIREFKIASDNFDSKQSYFTAESGVEDMMYRIKNSMNVGTVGSDRTLYMNSTLVPIPTELTDLGGGKKQITTTGDVNSNERTVSLSLTTSTGVSFNYGVLVGQGGVYLDSGIINGNTYANGPISASSSGSNAITGTAISANSPALVADQTNGSGVPANNITFSNASATEDIAQSFKITNSSPLNKIQLYIKKVSTPSNATVKIMNDSSGSIGSTIIASGTLLASTVTTSYGWVDISFSTNPPLDTTKTYWLVVDASYSSSKYYVIGATSGNSYINGISKIGKFGGTWNNTSPANLDYYFSIYLGGLNGSITGVSQWNQLHIGTTSGTAQAHTVNSVSSTGNIYCKSGSQNNKSCIDQPDPTYVAFPVSDSNIAEWKNDALSGGIYNGNYTVPSGGAILGPKKIVGNLTVGSGGLTVTGTLWVTGNVVMNGGGLTKLAASYGSNDAVIVADGTITVSNGGRATGSGTAGSYLMLLSLSSSTTAMNISGDAGAVITYAPYGTINVDGGSAIKEATGYKLNITGNSSISYESGLTNNNFSSGPSGSWSIDSWKESQ